MPGVMSSKQRQSLLFLASLLLGPHCVKNSSAYRHQDRVLSEPDYSSGAIQEGPSYESAQQLGAAKKGKKCKTKKKKKKDTRNLRSPLNRNRRALVNPRSRSQNLDHRELAPIENLYYVNQVVNEFIFHTKPPSKAKKTKSPSATKSPSSPSKGGTKSPSATKAPSTKKGTKSPSTTKSPSSPSKGGTKSPSATKAPSTKKESKSPSATKSPSGPSKGGTKSPSTTKSPSSPSKGGTKSPSTTKSPSGPSKGGTESPSTTKAPYAGNPALEADEYYYYYGEVDESEIDDYDWEICESSSPTISPYPTQPPSSPPTFSPTISPRPSNSPTDMPSDEPTISPQPSNSPTDMPSDEPTISPSQFPTNTPSDIPSNVPSSTPSDIPSINPSTNPSNSPSSIPSTNPSNSPSGIPSTNPSNNPSSIPSLKPSQNTLISNIPTGSHSPGCDEFEAGRVYETNLSATSTFKYELLSSSGTNLTEALANLEDELTALVGSELIYCGEQSGRKRQLLKSRKVVEGLKIVVRDALSHRKLQVDGIDMAPSDKVDTSSSCENLEANDGESCDVIDGSFTLYLREDSVESSELQSSQDALKEIKEIMSDGTLVNSNEGILGLFFLGGIIDGIPYNGGGDETFETPGAISNLQEVEGDSSGLSGAGIGIVVTACLITVAAVIVATKRRKSSQLKIIEDYVEEDASLFTKESDKKLLKGIGSSDDGTEIMSMASSGMGWRQTRSAHVLGEDDSVASHSFEAGTIMDDLRASEGNQLRGLERSRGRESQGLYYGPEEDDLGREHSASNVHKCTSATCHICSRNKSTKFISSDALMPLDEEDETLYGNNLGSRPYLTEDTVDF